MHWVQLRPWVCFKLYLLECAGSNFVPRCVLKGVCWLVLCPTLAPDVFWTLTPEKCWVQLWPKMCFEECLLIFTESNFGPKYVSNDVSWHVLGPTLALDVSWMVSADMCWVQLWPQMCFEWCLLICTGNTFSPGFFSKIQRCLMTCTGSNFGPRCVLIDVCWHVLGPTLALDVFWTLSADMYWVQLRP